MCFEFREFPGIVSSSFLFWLLVALMLGGGDVPLVCVLPFSTMTTGDSGTVPPLAAAENTSAASLVPLLVLTGTAET